MLVIACSLKGFIKTDKKKKDATSFDADDSWAVRNLNSLWCSPDDL